MSNKLWLFVCLTGAFATGAFAKDAVEASVTPLDTLLTPTIVVNGNPYSPGTYAVGTIQLFYEVNAMQFTAGPLASFQVNLADIAVNSTSQSPSYPVTLNLTQIGSTDLVLTPSPASFSVTGPGWSSSSMVMVSVAASVPGNPALNVDGAELVANMKLATSPSGSKLDTVTNIQVHVRLVHPTSCLRIYDFLMDQEMTGTVSSLPITLWPHGPKAGKTKNTAPPELSNNVLVVNTCSSTQTFDLSVNVDGDFGTVGANAVRTYFKSGYADPATFDLASFGSGTPQGTSHCLSNITLAAGNTLLTTVHITIGEYLPSQLPADGTFDFSASASVAGTGCPGTMNSMATPNPASLAIPFSIP
jgi:hypothetical protein